MSGSTSRETYRDCRHVLRYQGTHRAVLEPFNRGGSDFLATDALSIYEFSNEIRVQIAIPGLVRDRSGLDSMHYPVPTSPFLSSPNMDYLPNISKVSPTVIARKDGRFYTSDFTLFPQFYFEQTHYLAYVLKKPSIEEMPTHPFSYVWYDLNTEDFLVEEGCVLGDVGRIDPFVAENFTKLRKEMEYHLKEVELSGKYTPQELNDFRIAVRGCLFSSITLVCAPQSWNLTLLTVTSFQRFWHEAYACWRYLTFWKDRRINPSPTPFPVDKTIMGAITTDLETAMDLYAMGVPVWFLRPPSALPRDMNIVKETPLTLPSDIVREALPDAKPVYSGPASPVRNRACQSLKMSNISMGHSAYIVDGRLGSMALPVEKEGSSSFLSITPSHSSKFFTLHDEVPGHLRPNTTVHVETTDSLMVDVSQPSNSLSLDDPSPSSFAMSPPPSSSRISPAPSPAASSSFSAASSSSRVVEKENTMNVSIAREKFQEPSAAYMPATLASWVRALNGVNVDRRLLVEHKDFALLRGYPVLDPYSLATGDVRDRRFWIYIVSWLSIRPSWISYTTSRTAGGDAMPNPQEWKSFLGEKLGGQMGLFDLEDLQNVSTAFIHKSSSSSTRKQSSSKKKRQIGSGEAAKRARRRARTLGKVSAKFGIDISSITSPSDIFWNHRLITTHHQIEEGEVDISTQVLRQILWDLYEQNFRLEFLSLDRCIRSRDGMTTEQMTNLDAEVAACFPSQALINVNIPDSDDGLASSSWWDRAEYVEAFRKVLSQWGGDVAARLAAMSAVIEYGDRSVDAEIAVTGVEDVAHAFYCQTFFNYFGRAPTIPHSAPF